MAAMTSLKVLPLSPSSQAAEPISHNLPRTPLASVIGPLIASATQGNHGYGSLDSSSKSEALLLESPVAIDLSCFCDSSNRRCLNRLPVAVPADARLRDRRPSLHAPPVSSRECATGSSVECRRPRRPRRRPRAAEAPVALAAVAAAAVAARVAGESGRQQLPVQRRIAAVRGGSEAAPWTGAATAMPVPVG